jgi:hypothetical protein
MKRALFAQAVCLAALAVSACNQQSDEVLVETNETIAGNEEQASEPQNLDVAELPPMIERSPAYRCSDGDALYVDVLTDDRAVMVRDSRADVPVRLTRESAGQPFTGDGRTLSGTGSRVTYSTPDRPSQTCIESEG